MPCGRRPGAPLFPYTTLFRSPPRGGGRAAAPGGGPAGRAVRHVRDGGGDRKSTRLNSSHVAISYAVFCLKKKKRRVNHRDREAGDLQEGRGPRTVGVGRATQD